jgi:hypothetical protein
LLGSRAPIGPSWMPTSLRISWSCLGKQRGRLTRSRARCNELSSLALACAGAGLDSSWRRNCPGHQDASLTGEERRPEPTQSYIAVAFGVALRGSPGWPQRLQSMQPTSSSPYLAPGREAGRAPFGLETRTQPESLYATKNPFRRLRVAALMSLPSPVAGWSAINKRELHHE